MSQLLDLIGNTPLIQLKRSVPAYGAKVWVKWEGLNPSGHTYDRTALNLLETHLEAGHRELILLASPRFAYSAAYVAAILACDLHIYLTENCSKAMLAAIQSFGVDVKAHQGGEVHTAQVEHNKTGLPLLNMEADMVIPYMHEKTTAWEILEQTPGQVDAFVSSFQTGALLAGVAPVLRERQKKVEIYGVPALGLVKPYQLPYSPHSYDYEIEIESGLAKDMQLRLKVNEGLVVDLNSANAIAGAIEVAKKLGYDRNVVVVANRPLLAVEEEALPSQKLSEEPLVQALPGDIHA